jgi:hypothetical protein
MFTEKSVPLRGQLELDVDGIFVFIYFIPLAVGMPAGRNYLNENFSLGNGRHFNRAFFVRFQIELRQFFFAQKSTWLIVPNVNAGVRNWLVVIAADVNPQPGDSLVGQLFILGGLLVIIWPRGVGERTILRTRRRGAHCDAHRAAQERGTSEEKTLTAELERVGSHHCTVFRLYRNRRSRSSISFG